MTTDLSPNATGSWNQWIAIPSQQGDNSACAGTNDPARYPTKPFLLFGEIVEILVFSFRCLMNNTSKLTEEQDQMLE